MKHLNRLEQVLASAELREAGAAEGILLDRQDHVVCAVAANIFLVMEDRLITPRLDLCGVRGVVRSHILAGYGARCEQRRVTLDMVQEADEVFICNTVKGIVPVTAIDDQEFDIGPVTRELQNWLTEGARAT
jgi:4-amino-4-deoxychorismate lyase